MRARVRKGESRKDNLPCFTPFPRLLAQREIGMVSESFR